MLKKIFLDHPTAVDETYLEHLRTASSFGLTMMLAGTACLLHGLIPALFTRTGSTAIRRLHGRMVVARAAKQAVPARGDTHGEAIGSAG